MKKRAYACLVPYRRNGKILLQQRTDDSPSQAGYWAFFGGSIEEGETPEQALERELLEELEYKIKLPPRLFLKQEYEQRGMQVTSHEFMEEFDASQRLILHEGQGYAWFTPEEALKLKISDRRRNSFVKIKEVLDKLLARKLQRS